MPGQLNAWLLQLSGTPVLTGMGQAPRTEDLNPPLAGPAATKCMWRTLLPGVEAPPHA